MNIQYLNEVSNAMHEFMNSHEFSSKEQETGVFKGQSKVYKVEYTEAKKVFSISVAAIDEEGEVGEYKSLSTWYFDEESHGANDTKCIAEDFVRAVAKDNGIKIVSAENGIKEVELPKKAEAGAEPGIEAFTQKFLAMFPQYKEAYKAEVAKYGDFLYVNFFKNYGVGKMKELMADENKNKKQLQKYWKMLGEMHYEGESSVGDLVCAVIIAPSFGGDVAAFNTAAANYLEDFPFLKTSAAAAVKNFKNDKKLRNALGF